MEEVVLTFYNTHGAISGEAALLGAGIGVRVMPVPGEISAGCGLCLRVSPEEYEASRQACRAAGIEIQQVYSKTDTGYSLWEPEE